MLVERQLPETVVRPAVSGELESRLHVIKQEILSRARLTDLINRFDLYADLRARGDMETALEQVRRDIQVELTGPEQVSGRTKTVAFNLTFTGEQRGTRGRRHERDRGVLRGPEQSDALRRGGARPRSSSRRRSENAKTQLDQNEKQVKAYTSQHVGELPQQVEVNLATLERLNTQLRLNGERQMRTLDQRDKLFEFQRPSPAPAAPVGASPGDIRLERLKRDLAQLEGFPDKHPDVRRIKDEIAALEARSRIAPIRRLRSPTSDRAAGADAPAPRQGPHDREPGRRSSRR